MKLATQSIPYRALQKVSGVVVLLLFLATANDWGLAIAIAASAGVLAIAGAYEVVYYRRFEYELTEDTLDISSGVISRREREIPYRRIQNVDVSRNVVQRALGIAAVNLETAGGSSTEGSIRYVVPAEATRLQREVQRRKSETSSAREETDENGDPVGPVEEDLFAITPGELALVGALSFDGRLIGLLAFVGSGSFPVLSGFLPSASAAMLTATAIVAIGILFLISWILGAAVAFSNYYGFRLSRAGDELRYERGLFRRYSGSIPTEKVQTLTLSDNPAKRVLGYATLSIETAGYAPGQGGEYGSQAAVPIASTGRVYELAREVESFGDPDFSRPPKRIRWRYAFRYTMVLALLSGVGFIADWWLTADLPWYLLAGLLVAVPPAAQLKWKHRGYWLGEDHLLTRNGFWSRQIRVVPYYRIQNVIDTRTYFQRRWNVATVVADTAGTSSIVGSDAAAVDFDVEEVERLRAELTDRLQIALADRRARRTAFEWFDGSVARRPSDDAATTPEADSSDDASTADATRRDERPSGDGPASNGTPSAGASDADGSDEDGSGADDSGGPTGVVEPEPDDAGGVVRPEFAPDERDYSEPAEPIDTGEYAVDHHPSDADVPHRPDSNPNLERTDPERIDPTGTDSTNRPVGEAPETGSGGADIEEAEHGGRSGEDVGHEETDTGDDAAADATAGDERDESTER